MYKRQACWTNDTFAHNDENQYNQFFINYPYDVLNSIGLDNIGKISVVKISPTINENVCNTTLNEVPVSYTHLDVYKRQ